MPLGAKQSFQATIRASLRQATRPAHDRVDAAFGRFDLTSREDYAAFLQAHHEALSTLADPDPPFGLPRIDLCPALEADLAALDVAPRMPVSARHDADDAFRLGRYYVIAGSQAGAQLLRRAWSRSTDGIVLSAGRYFAACTQGEAWAAFRRLDPPPDLDQPRLLSGAEATFDAFHAAALRSLDRPTPQMRRMTHPPAQSRAIEADGAARR
jgi:heme oxygenase